MTRAFLLLPLAALAAGCYSSNNNYCDVTVYWTPGPAPNGGFQVPGLVAAGFPPELDCAAAGVTTVQVLVNGVFNSNWACATNGVTLSLRDGLNSVQIDAYDSLGNPKYSSAVTVDACFDTAVGIFPQGVEGTLGIPYTFADVGNACAGASNLWFQVTSGGAVYDFVDDTSANPTAIACTNVLANRVIDVLTPSGGSLVPAGVYTRTRIEEVSQQAGGFVLQRANCAQETVVHAGDDSWPVVALSVSGTFCP